jgi:hypothetical protein
MGSDDLLDYGRRIGALEAKVSALYGRLGQAEPLGGGGFSEPELGDPGEDPRLIELIEAGNTLHAIKLYRELTGSGLAEAASGRSGSRSTPAATSPR